jgi:hypothetical protein
MEKLETKAVGNREREGSSKAKRLQLDREVFDRWTKVSQAMVGT